MNLKNKKKIDSLIGPLLVCFLKPLTYFLGTILKRPHDLSIQGDILVIKLLGGGSLTNFLPVGLSFKKKFPEKKLKLLCTNSVFPFAKALGIFDEIKVLDEKSFFTLVLSYLKVCWSLLGTDTIIDLEVHSRTTTVVGLFTGARNRIGFFVESVLWRKDIYTHLIFYNRYANRSIFYDKVAQLFGLAPASQNECRQFFLKYHRMQMVLSQNIILSPCSSELAKSERELTVAQWIQAFKSNSHRVKGKNVLILSVQSDFLFCEELRIALSESSLGLSVQNKAGQTSLTSAIELVLNSECFIGIDSSLAHFAHLFGKPGIYFWGPTAPEIVFNRSWKSEAFHNYQKANCSPCVHIAEEPPCYGNNICIKSLFGTNDESLSNFVPSLGPNEPS